MAARTTPIGLANGVLQVNNVLLGTYTITETMAPRATRWTTIRRASLPFPAWI